MAFPSDDFTTVMWAMFHACMTDPIAYRRSCETLTAPPNFVIRPEPGDLARHRDELALHIAESSHRPLGLAVDQWRNDEWLRDLWFDLFGPLPPPGDPFPVAAEDWAHARSSPYLRHLGRDPSHRSDHAALRWLADRNLRLEHARLDAPEQPRPEPPHHARHLRQLGHDGRRVLPPAKYGPYSSIDDHEAWYRDEYPPLSASARQFAVDLGIDPPLVLHQCPDLAVHRESAWGPHCVSFPAVPRFVVFVPPAGSSTSLALLRPVVAHEMGHIVREAVYERLPLPDSLHSLPQWVRYALLFLVGVGAGQFWLGLPVLMALAVVVMRWLDRRVEFACDDIGARLGEPLTADAAAYLEGLGTPLGRRDHWLNPFPQWVYLLTTHPSWKRRLARLARTRRAHARHTSFGAE